MHSIKIPDTAETSSTSQLSPPELKTFKGCIKPSFPGRFKSIHPKRTLPNYNVEEVMKFPAIALFYVGLLPPCIGSISSVIIALVFHNSLISGYDWQCGAGFLTCF